MLLPASEEEENSNIMIMIMMMMIFSGVLGCVCLFFVFPFGVSQTHRERRMNNEKRVRGTTETFFFYLFLESIYIIYAIITSDHFSAILPTRKKNQK